MKKILVFGLLLIVSITISGCINIKESPVIKVNITFVDNRSIAEVKNYTLTPGNVNYFNRPKNVQAESFPAIAARASFLEGKNSVIGPWEMLPYKGDGTYTFNIGFDERRYPKINDTIHVSIVVVDKNGTRIGYFIKNIKWE